MVNSSVEKYQFQQGRNVSEFAEFDAARVMVVGDLMLDRYWNGTTSRVSPEAPVPIVLVKGVEERVGGAGNVALNMSALGVRTTLLGYTGNDDSADSVTRLMDEAGISHFIERIEGISTITKLRIISRHQQLIRLDFEDGYGTVASDELINQYESQLKNHDVVVLSDYAKGSLNQVRQLIKLAKDAGKPVLVDPKGVDFSKYAGATLLTPNLSEFEAVVGVCHSQNEIIERGMFLMEQLQLESLLITRGENGMTLLKHDQEPLHLPTHARDVYDVTGAGDTVIATLAAGLAAGFSIDVATRFSNVAAGIVVGKLGTATVSRDELLAELHGRTAEHRGVIEIDRLVPIIRNASVSGEKIVLTNGCFDILHPGHVHYLQKARELGDRLVVLVNSDESVKRLKGEGRPINKLSCRMFMLAALECVDWVVAFDGDTPRDEICRILPDILVKGGDYTDVTKIAGYDCVIDNGGEVITLDFVQGFSTTQIIETIRSN